MSERLVEDVQSRGNFGFSIARLLPASTGRAPLAIAAFLSLPLFFSSLMASALAQEKPVVHQWKGCRNGLCTTWRDPSVSNTTHIWLWAILPSLVLVLIGWIACRVPLGFYVSCVSSIVIAMAVVHKTATWAAHHTARFPWGVDLIPANQPQSNHWDPGQWEDEARSTALSLQHWTQGIALAAMLVMVALWARSKYANRPRLDIGAAEGMHAPDATTPEL